MEGSVAISGWEALPDQVRSYATEFLTFSKSSTENTVRMCEVLYQAKNKLESEQFTSLQKAIGYGSDASSKTIIKYLQIGKYAEKFRPYLDRLPNTWTTLYEITQLPSEKFIEAMETGLITASSRGMDVKAIIKEPQKPAEAEPLVILHLGKSIDRAKLLKLSQEIEAMKIDYELHMELNFAANKIIEV